jgi:hypothetical protein
VDKLIENLVDQVPSTVAVIVVVMVFIKYIARRDEFWKELHEDHMEARRLSRECLDKNTFAMHENTMASHRLTEHLLEIRSVCPYSNQQVPSTVLPPTKAL